MKLTQWIAAGALSLAAGVANAAVITDSVSINKYIAGKGTTHTWTHDITDNGFAVGGNQQVTSANLNITFRDDRGRIFKNDIHLEYAQISANGDVISTHGLIAGAGLIHWIEVDTGTWGKNLGLSAVARLNSQGLLDVQVRNSADGVTSLTSDFYIVSSSLTVNTEEVANVPEPASLAVLGLGLAGLGAARRRAAKA